MEESAVAASTAPVAGFNEAKQRRGWNCDAIVGMNVKCLTFFGILLPEEKEGKWMDWSLARTAIFFGFFYVTQLSSEIINMYTDIQNPDKLSSASFLFLTHLVQTSKWYHVFRYHTRLRNLLKSINREEFKPQNAEQLKILQFYAKMSEIITTTFLGACVATCAFWAVYPFTEEEIRLPLAGWFPWKTNTTAKFTATFIYQTIAATINGLTNITKDTTIAGLIMVICGQLQILNNSLKNIRQLAESEMISEDIIGEDEMTPELHVYMDKKLKECIIQHKCILEFTDEVSFLFSSSVFGQFLISVIIICLTLFEMALMPFASLKFFSLVLYLYCILLEIFLWCYFGNEVSVQSSQLTNFAFESDWRNCSKEFRRNLLFFMTNSQKVLKLYAGGFLTLSLDTFVVIVKSAWSYFAVLLQVNKKNQL